MGNRHEKTRKRMAGCIGILLLFLLLSWVLGKEILGFIGDAAAFRAWVNAHKTSSRLVFVGMIALQVIVAVIPGEPLEVMAGYAFGVIEGTILTMIGIFIGGLLVFLLVKRFGLRFVTAFIAEEKLTRFRFLENETKLSLIVFVLFLIPGTPKDIMTYMVGLTPMKLSRWALISLVARFPSIITSTLGGAAMGVQDFGLAIKVFAVTILISALGLFAYNNFTQKRSGKKTDRYSAGA